MRRTITTLAVAALALTGCASGDETDPTASPEDDLTASPTPTDDEESEPSPSPSDDGTDPSPQPTEGDDVAAMEFTDCEAGDYTVGHPARWEVNEPTDLVDACRVFHPEQIDLPDDPQGIGLQWAVRVDIDNVAFEDLVAADPAGEVLQEEQTTVDGRDARVIEVRADGEALVPQGETRYGYAIDLGGRTLFASTYSVGDTDYERDKQVLDRMVTQELRVHDDTEMIDGPSTTERSTRESDGTVVLTDVDIGAHDSFDRLVFEFTGEGEAGWLIEYDEDPRSQGRGDRVAIEGDAVLRVALRRVPYPSATPVEPYEGPERIQPERTDAIVEVVQDVLYEGFQDFFVGLDERRPYRVERLTDPQRVVIDIETG